MEFFIFVLSLFFVLIPLAISNNNKSGWSLPLILFVSILISPVLCIWALAGVTFGNYDNLALAIICLLLPTSLVLIINGEKIK